jgi:hypothetical protein
VGHPEYKSVAETKQKHQFGEAIAILSHEALRIVVTITANEEFTGNNTGLTKRV